MIFGTRALDRSLGWTRVAQRAGRDAVYHPSFFTLPFLPRRFGRLAPRYLRVSRIGKERKGEEGSEEEASKGSRNWRREGERNFGNEPGSATNSPLRPPSLSVHLFLSHSLGRIEGRVRVGQLSLCKRICKRYVCLGEIGTHFAAQHFVETKSEINFHIFPTLSHWHLLPSLTSSTSTMHFHLLPTLPPPFRGLHSHALHSIASIPFPSQQPPFPLLPRRFDVATADGKHTTYHP